MRKIGLIIVSGIISLLPTELIFAQQYFNNYQYVLGERAAGLGGAYTAIANDSSALWYNPGGLSRIQDFHLNISANTYSYLKTKTEGYWELPTQSGSKPIDLEESDFSVVANTLIFGKKLGDRQAISFGIIIPYQDTLLGSMETKGLTDPYGDTLSFTDESSFVSKYYLAMFGYGVKLDDDLNAGASLGIGYYNAKYKENYILRYTDNTTQESMVAGNYSEDNTQYTAQLGIGFQAEISKSQRIGLYAQTPTYRISGESKYKEISYGVTNAGYDGSDDSWTEWKQKDDPFKQVLPGFISIGYGYEKAGSSGFSLDIVPVFPVSGGESDAKNTVVNIKAGLEKYLSDSMIVRAGLFTDFSQKDDVKATLETLDGTDKIDFYGGTLSLSVAKHFSGTEAKKEGNKTTYTPVKRSLWSTFGIVTKYGKGDVKVTRFDANYKEIPQIKEKSVLNFQVFIAESVAF